jgi:hypothetical protein
MGVNRQQRGATALVVLAVLLGSLWAGGLAQPAPGDPTGQLAASHPPAGIEPAVLRDRGPALRPSAGPPGPGGRLLPLLAGMLVAALGVAGMAGAGRPRPAPPRARSLVRAAPRGARAPPLLQPA